MKNLFKLLVAVVLVVAVMSCESKSKKAAEEKARTEFKKDSIAKAVEVRKNNTFLRAMNSIPTNQEDFFVDLFKRSHISEWMGSQKYFTIPIGSSVEYSNQDMTHTAVLPHDVIAITMNNQMSVKTGIFKNVKNARTTPFNVYMTTEYELELAVKILIDCELSVTTPDFEGLHPTLESFLKSAKERDSFGYRPDVAHIWTKIYVVEFDNGEILVYNKDGNRRELRSEAAFRRGNVYDDSVGLNFVLPPHYKELK